MTHPPTVPDIGSVADVVVPGQCGRPPMPRRPITAAAPLLGRARRLRALAVDLNPILADAYRRRAAELSLEAWARAAGSAPVAVDDFAVAAA
jgi:hypothetical protein